MTAEWLHTRVEEYQDDDDVFHPTFLSIVVFLESSGSRGNISDEARRYLESVGNRRFLFIPSTQLSPGPYALIGSELRQVWKIVDDFNGTCMSTLKPQAE